MIEEKLLIGAVQHIKYELDMLNYATHQLIRSDLSIEERNVCVEAFVIHARCLTDFLYTPATAHKDDILAEHYFTNPSDYFRNRPEMHALLSVAKGRANKEMAHLTYNRVGKTLEEKQWSLEIYNEINLAFSKFLNSLSPERRAWFPIRYE